MTLTINSMKSSDLSRNPAKVYSEAEKEPLLLTRRDGEDLVVMSAKEAEMRTWLMELAATLLGIATSTNGTLVERMCTSFPWMLTFDEDGRSRFTDKLFEAVKISLATGQTLGAWITFDSHKESAEFMAAGIFGAAEDDILAEPIIVERPE